MSSATVIYHWFRKVAKSFQSMTKPQARVLAAFSYGVALSGSCALAKSGQAVPSVGKVDTVERRWQRFLSNGQIPWEQGCQDLAGWVFSHLLFASRTLVLLVDETTLAEHLKVMAVSLAYRGRAIPLAWWCYRQDHYPMGQVKLIDTLLGWIAPHVPPGSQVLVQADRGIGTSPGLLRCIEKRGWQYLVRVQGAVRLRLEAEQKSAPFKSLVRGPGQQWSGWVMAFKKAGWRRCWATAYWGRGYQEPWLLLSNWPGIQGPCYGWRMWQELAFRDFKSYGWNWQRSRVRDPDHANRLWLVMALAYAWVLSLGTQAAHLVKVRCQVARGTQRRQSLFTLGIRVIHGIPNGLKQLFRRFDLVFIPLIEPYEKTVVQ